MALEDMPSQDPALNSFAEDVIEAGHEEELDNEARGCGHLQHNACYVRSDVSVFASATGELPRFVELDDPVEYRESQDRGALIPGYKEFPGVEFGIAYVNDGGTTTPPHEIRAHHDRLHDRLRFDGDHYGEITVARAHDLLMSVGKSHWPTPADFIEETRERGLNLKVPAGVNRDPPVINPFRTRCWVVHPHGAGEGRPGIIGFAILTRAVFTCGPDATADDPDIPAYAQDWYETGKVDLATPGPETTADDDDGDEAESPDAGLDEFMGDE